jgi:hypothetical protein
VTTFFHDTYTFDVGGRRFELYAAPGGETLDSLIVWLPEERTAFTGQFMGALYKALPHLYTPRGDRQRSARFHLRGLDLLLELGPELLVTGSPGPFHGAERIRSDLETVRAAVQFIHDETIAGMNAGKSLWTLMQEIKLPPALDVGESYGKLTWSIRGIYEGYVGWYDGNVSGPFARPSVEFRPGAFAYHLQDLRPNSRMVFAVGCRTASFQFYDHPKSLHCSTSPLLELAGARFQRSNNRNDFISEESRSERSTSRKCLNMRLTGISCLDYDFGSYLSA